MPLIKQKSKNRLSGLFSSSTAHDDPVVEPHRQDGLLHASDARVRHDHNRTRSDGYGNSLYQAGAAISTDQLPIPANAQQFQTPHGRPRSLVEPNLMPPPPNYGFTASPARRDASPQSLQSRSRSASGAASNLAAVPSTDSLGSTVPNKIKRRSIFGGFKGDDRRKPGDGDMFAWVAGHDPRLPYNVDFLLRGEQVPELWDDGGNTFVYLFPKGTNRGPSFRLDSSVFAASPALARLAFDRVTSDFQGQSAIGSRIPTPANTPTISKRKQPIDSALRNMSLNGTETPPMTPELQATETESSTSSKGSRVLSEPADTAPSEVHLYLPVPLPSLAAGGPDAPLSQHDIESLLNVRNFFSFLVGGSLVATEQCSSMFQIFMAISKLLQHFEFSNFDGSTFGEVAASSFGKYVDELILADIRYDLDKNIDAIILGERMKCWPLYNEGFVHGVGKYEDITSWNTSKYEIITGVTKNRMERASMDLHVREKNVNARLRDFEFPAIFSGVMNSKTADERKSVRFDAWKSSFIVMKRHVLSYYKHKYGAWPPKASSKKNSLETSGLNRLVLNELYHDFSSLYDLLVDRKALTTRGADGLVDETAPAEDPVHRAMRRVMSEYDRSSPPVQPPVPFDVPMIPCSRAIRQDSKARLKKPKTEEMHQLLEASHNPDAQFMSLFVASYLDLERKSTHHKTIDEACDFRCGSWILLYAVLQSLPMLVVDAPGIRFTEGVEYFLCEVPRSALPWTRDPEANQQRNWYGVAGSGDMVSLPADIVEHGVEGIYRRSHCWTMAEKWTAHSAILSAAVQETFHPAIAELPVAQAPSMLGPPHASRNSSPSGSARRRESVMMLGLEALPHGSPAPSRPVSRGGVPTPPMAVDPSKTFDAILQSVPNDGKKKKR